MASTNYTITGTGFRIQSELGDFYQSGGFAIVQWTAGYEPRYRPLYEWTQTNLTMVNWVGEYNIAPIPTFTSAPFAVNDPGPLYLYVDFGSQYGGTQSYNYGQAFLGQITDVLTLPGGNVEINLNAANIRPMMGSRVGDILRTQDFNTWTPQAVPEPSYAWPAGFLFLGVVAARLMRAKQPHKTTQASEGKLPAHTS